MTTRKPKSKSTAEATRSVGSTRNSTRPRKAAVPTAPAQEPQQSTAADAARPRNAAVSHESAQQSTAAEAARPRNAAVSHEPAQQSTASGAARPRNAAVSHEPTREMIAIEAFLIWERQGRPHGQALEHWLEAERRLTLQMPSA